MPSLLESSTMPIMVVKVVVIAGVLFLLSGGLFTIVNWGDLPLFISYQESYSFILPFDFNTQLILEGIVSFMFLAMGFVGGYIIHRSQRGLTDSRTASMLLIVGVIFLLVGVFGLSSFLALKS